MEARGLRIGQQKLQMYHPGRFLSAGLIICEILSHLSASDGALKLHCFSRPFLAAAREARFRVSAAAPVETGTRHRLFRGFASIERGGSQAFVAHARCLPESTNFAVVYDRGPLCPLLPATTSAADLRSARGVAAAPGGEAARRDRCSPVAIAASTRRHATYSDCGGRYSCFMPASALHPTRGGFRPSTQVQSIRYTSPARMSEQVSGATGRHRNAAELQAALRVINDQLADANDLERPALELVAQKLTGQLLEVELEQENKHERGHRGEEAKRAPCREAEAPAGVVQPASSSSAAAAAGEASGEASAAQSPPAAEQQQQNEGGQVKHSEKHDDWDTFVKDLPRVLISNGTQKYVLIRIGPEQNPSKHLEKSIYLVRGNPAVEYHYQCALETMKELESMGAEGEILGGGRIECRMKEKEVEIYGHSYQFGRADHAITAQLIKDAFGSDFQVSWGDYGY